MTACAAQEESPQRSAILRRARDRTDHEELIERQLHVMPVAAADAELRLDVLRREQLCRAYRVAESRRVSLEREQDSIQELLTLLPVPSPGNRVGSVLHDGREHVPAGRRQARVDGGRHDDLEQRGRRELSVFGIVERALDGS